ncbi:uncharacterized protein K489DRAFT_403428 [Dissoconium aciculare CBS 342.82]|uniref:Uncharacterized protein n=1 Tax=Dissoconium aciculare CBS 342.82 TaxID=1314786 RepID=A0A6J3LWL1_9PEZI|nr:uncharacterized protein K489DRAFT_403428 [Dissoconium aciculare CBS 342.82]KAF1820038.1 hypothetical protein K489DRAFT_403428 [Dissoconium aciculare CBS 342.82]
MIMSGSHGSDGGLSVVTDAAQPDLIPSKTIAILEDHLLHDVKGIKSTPKGSRGKPSGQWWPVSKVADVAKVCAEYGATYGPPLKRIRSPSQSSQGSDLERSIEHGRRAPELHADDHVDFMGEPDRRVLRATASMMCGLRLRTKRASPHQDICGLIEETSPLHERVNLDLQNVPVDLSRLAPGRWLNDFIIVAALDMFKPVSNYVLVAESGAVRLDQCDKHSMTSRYRPLLPALH